jgi:hypothetical protein
MRDSGIAEFFSSVAWISSFPPTRLREGGYRGEGWEEIKRIVLLSVLPPLTPPPINGKGSTIEFESKIQFSFVFFPFHAILPPV